MSNPAATLSNLPKPIQGRGLTNAGVIILQFLLILLVETFEYSITQIGIMSGIAIIVSLLGAIYLGRDGTSFAAVVNPPIAFFISTVVILATIGGAGLHIARFGLDLVSSLGAGAPYLVVQTVIGWGYYFWRKRSLTSGA
jgi:hypothetical protein